MAPEPPDSWERLRGEITGCRACPRLVRFREEIAGRRKPAHRTETYWGRPVTGFGDPNARLVVVGLAPAPHGGNRTGRVFTGDRSAAFLVRSLHAAGFANQPTSLARSDGLRYTDAFITAAVRCAPPGNHPKPDERDRCLDYLVREMRLLSRARAFLALGGFAWEATRRAAESAYGVTAPRVPFAHGACAPLGPGRPILWGSYHPSPLNTQTGRLTRAMFDELLARVRAGFEARAAGGTR